MKILALLTPAAGKQPSDFEPLVVNEEKSVWAAYKAGIIREFYLQPQPLAVSLIFEASSHDAVQAELAKFPMVQAGLLDIRLVSLGPWLPLEALFDAAHRA